MQMETRVLHLEVEVEVVKEQILEVQEIEQVEMEVLEEYKLPLHVLLFLQEPTKL